MKYRCLAALLLLTLACASPVSGKEAFQSLFNGRDLLGWNTWLGARKVPWMPLRLWGEWKDVIGLNNDQRGVFSVVAEDGAPAIRVSGEIWGALVSERSYGDYHLRLQYKWGEDKFAPREDKPRNTGLLYHSTGAYGAFWSYWIRSAEFEIMEGSTGNFSPVDGIGAVIPAAWDFSLPIPWLRFAEDGSERDVRGLVFRVQASLDREKPTGQWNQIELYVLGDRAVHIVNGERVLTVRQLREQSGEGAAPLTAGRIQLQSEGAEVFFRNIELRNISSIPGE